MKIIFIFSCSGMFRNVPACSGMFHVPGFIDALTRNMTKVFGCYEELTTNVNSSVLQKRRS